MYADRREDIDEILAGDIGAVLGLKDFFTGDTLCDASIRSCLENITFPEPVISVAIEPRTTPDQDKMSEALHKLSDEDPTFRVHVDEETGQTIISGMGELHLEILMIACCVNFGSRLGSVNPRWLIVKPSPALYKKPSTATSNKLVAWQYGHVVLSWNQENLERNCLRE